jgi:hypothetical protein
MRIPLVCILAVVISGKVFFFPRRLLATNEVGAVRVFNKIRNGQSGFYLIFYCCKYIQTIGIYIKRLHVETRQTLLHVSILCGPARFVKININQHFIIN